MNSENQARGHVTSNEISRWLVEGPELSVSRHLENCSACKAKLTEAQEPLAAFRSALVQWSEAQAAQALPLPSSTSRNGIPRASGLWLPAASFALATLVMVGYAKVPALFHGKSSARQPVVAASALDSDEALLNQVDTEVSEAVPDALAPLTDLVSWDSSEGLNRQSIPAQKQAARSTSTKPAIVKIPADVTD